MPPALSYLKDFYAWPDRSPFCSFYQYYHFGAPFSAIAEDVAREAPDVVGISVLFSPYYREALRTAEEVKKRLGVPIVLGGSHVSAAPLTAMQQPYVDFIVRGEGEKPLVEFMKAVRAGGDFSRIPNLGFKINGACRLNEIEDNFPLEELPAPDFSDFAVDRYLFAGRPLSFVLTSRGCPHRCAFCSVHLTFGRYRRRSSESIVDEIRLRYRQGYRVFDFEDDNFTFCLEDVKHLCRQLIAAFPARDVELVAMNGISYHSLDQELLRLLKQAGFTHLNLSLVSSDARTLRAAGRPHTIEKYLEVVREAFELGLAVVSYQILGLPGEDLDSMVKTMILAARLPVLLGASPFYLTPGSPIAKIFPEPEEADIVKSRLTAMAIETGAFAREDIFTLFVTTRIVNFLKSIHLEAEDASIAEVLSALKYQGDREKIGGELLEKLLSEKMLYASTRKDLEPIRRFRFPLFYAVWSGLEKIATREGKTIWTNSRFRPL